MGGRVRLCLRVSFLLPPDNRETFSVLFSLWVHTWPIRRFMLGSLLVLQDSVVSMAEGCFPDCPSESHGVESGPVHDPVASGRRFVSTAWQDVNMYEPDALFGLPSSASLSEYYH